MLKILDIIFPPTCGSCGKIGKQWLCNKCYRSLRKSVNLKRFRLSKSLYVNYMFIYKDKLREIILSYKFSENSYLYRTFSEMILKDKKARELIDKFDYIIPAPMYIDNKKKRGYNQTELIAKEIAKNTDVIYDNKILIKTKNNKTQSTLNEFERTQNIKNVYGIVNSEKIKNKKILLFDDICTTGATVKECYKELKKYAKEVTVLVLAKSNYKKG